MTARPLLPVLMSLPKNTDHAALLTTARALETWALDSGFPTAAKVIHNLLEALETEVANRLLTSPGSLSRTVAGISSALSASPDEKIPDDSSPQVADLILRLNVACIGRPHAKIPWPHRLLHDARETLQAQQKENTELRALLNASRSAQYTS